MESDSAGLDVIRHVRETLGNSLVRIVLRTGRTKHAPGKKMLEAYGINDYRDKTELTVERLTTTIISALRSYYELSVIDQNRKEHIVRFHTVFNTSAIAMSIISAEGNFLRVNPRFIQLTGYSVNELLQMSTIDITFPEDREYSRQALDDILVDRISFAEYEKRYLKKDGGYFWGHITISCVRDENRHPLYFISQMQDISKRKESEEALRRANLELEAFAHTVAHDLRNPLTPIIAYAGLLQNKYEELLDNQTCQMLNKITEQANRMLSMMEDMLLLAKNGELACPVHPVESADVVGEILEEHAPLIQESAAAIIKRQLPSVMIPKNMLFQVLGNIIGNAIKYAGKEGSPIEISGERSGEIVRFMIVDHGPGIPENEKENIFRLYYRSPEHKHLKGSGVGLATAKKIARMYHGDIILQETSGGGCTFIVEIMECKNDTGDTYNV